MSEESLFETNLNKASFCFRVREYNGYFDLNSVNACDDTTIKIATLYSDRESAINNDMFSVVKKILVESPINEDFFAYIDDDGIACIEYLNGKIIKQGDPIKDMNLFDDA